ncbi:nitrite reductase small subunit NirD [Nocardioides sp.]|uniref:nitrite reductase small subunit NirD n=1 Tax=Nocardioides sp. TaxID=35761 RepID=UPI002B26AC0D|nr:nitrite reductase small subunit NirD [Nocardioides sp.]
MTSTRAETGTRICPLEAIEVEGGVVALVDGEAVAVLRTYADEVFAVSNYDPIGRASVMSRGIIGSRLIDGVDVPFVASPLHKQGYDLRTGVCLDDPETRIPTYTARVCADGAVWVGAKELHEPERH